jgi:VIT1/CCC1 family predicted Fe2+/Mn2+ transporter
MLNSETIVEAIQLMLAPGLMISACGLLLLGMNNKYSLVVNRIRLLNEERRKIVAATNSRDFTPEQNVRIGSISLQLEKLVYRVRLVKNTVLSYTMAVALFVITSFFIGLSFFFHLTGMNQLIITSFILGMMLVLTGVVLAAYETKKGYEIIQLEVKIDE